MSDCICPKCKEGNPPDAIICWACYTPLSHGPTPPLRVRHDEPELDFNPPPWRAYGETILAFFMIGALLSSGWWKGKTRFGILGTGLGALALLLALDKRDKAKRDLDKRESESPIRRIADTILLYALTDKAARIQLNLKTEGISVEYLIGNEWYEQMRIPKYVWAALKNEFNVRAGREKIHFAQDGETGIFALEIHIEPPLEEIILISS